MQTIRMQTIEFRACQAALILFVLALGWPVGFTRAAGPPDAQDQGSLKQLSLEQLGNLEVTTASKSPQQVWKTPAAIYVITQDDIRRSGALTIPEALRLAPGVEVARIDANKWSVGIRGFGSRLARSVLVLFDGRNVYNTLEAGTYWEVQDTVLEDIDRIEVIRGPGGTVWGPNAVNGVINIITKNSKDTQGFLVSVATGSLKRGYASVRYGGSNNSGLSYRIYAKGFERGAEFHPDNQNYDSWRAAQAGFRLDWVKNARDTFTLQGDGYDEGAGETVTLTNYTPPYSQTVTGTERLSGGNILGRWTREFHEGDDLQLQVYYDRTDRYEPNFGDRRNTFDVDFLRRSYLGSRNHVTWGLGARFSEGDELAYSSGLFFDPSMRTDDLFSAFVQDNISIIPDRLTFEAGTKILHTDFTGVELEPSGRLLWTPTETETFWAAVTHAVRTPSDVERDFFLSGFIGMAPNPQGGAPLPLFARFNANRNFQSEKLNGYELGFRRVVRKSLYLDVAGLFNQYYDLFSEDILGSPFVETSFENISAPAHLLLPAEFGNGLEGSTIGGEIAPEWKPTSFWTLKGSYAFLHMVIKKEPGSLDVGSAAQVAGSSPQHQVVAQSQMDLPKHFTFDLTYRYVSPLSGLGVAAYSTGDARLAWNLARHFEFSVVGSNLMQPHHIEFPSDPGPSVGIRRSVYGKLVWTSKENSTR